MKFFIGQFIINMLIVANAYAAQVLLIGDSHTVGYFGQALKKELKPTNNVIRYGVVGSKSSDWNREVICPSSKPCGLGPGFVQPISVGPSSMEGKPSSTFPGFLQIQSHTKSELLIFALGTNDARNGCLSSSPVDIEAAASLIKQLSPGQECVWVGPPTYSKGEVINKCGQTKYKAFVDKLRSTVKSKGCRYIDSRAFRALEGRDLSSIVSVNDCQVQSLNQKKLESDTPDQLHFSKPSGEYWARCVALKLK